jgi:hypothetical protein
MKKIWTLIILLVLIILGFNYYPLIKIIFSSNRPSQNQPSVYKNEGLIDTYTILRTDSWRDSNYFLGMGNYPSNQPEWIISNKNIVLKNVPGSGFLCGSIPATSSSYIVHPTLAGVPGSGDSISVVDCGKYYFMYVAGDSPPVLFGPFDKL